MAIPLAATSTPSPSAFSEGRPLTTSTAVNVSENDRETPFANINCSFEHLDERVRQATRQLFAPHVNTAVQTDPPQYTEKQFMTWAEKQAKQGDLHNNSKLRSLFEQSRQTYESKNGLFEIE